MANLPLFSMAQNAIWCQIVITLAADLLTWTQLLGCTGALRAAEPKRLRLHLLGVAGRLVRGGRRFWLRLDAGWRWAGELVGVVARLQALPRLE